MKPITSNLWGNKFDINYYGFISKLYLGFFFIAPGLAPIWNKKGFRERRTNSNDMCSMQSIAADLCVKGLK